MPLRTLIAIDPTGANLDAALSSPADAIVLTLTDARFPVDLLRTSARLSIEKAVREGKRALVAVNHPRTRLLRDDIAEIIGPDLGGVILPHTVEPQDVRDLAVVLRELELKHGIEPGDIAAFPQIDTARGLLRAAEIVQAAPRVGGLIFHTKRYAADTGARDEEKGERLAYARGAVVAAARAFDRLPIVAATHLEAKFVGQYGFAGILLPPDGNATVSNVAFAVNEGQVARAREEIEAYENARAEGAWVARLGDAIIDSHAARKARQRLD